MYREIIVLLVVWLSDNDEPLDVDDAPLDELLVDVKSLELFDVSFEVNDDSTRVSVTSPVFRCQTSV